MKINFPCCMNLAVLDVKCLCGELHSMLSWRALKQTLAQGSIFNAEIACCKENCGLEILKGNGSILKKKSFMLSEQNIIGMFSSEMYN